MKVLHATCEGPGNAAREWQLIEREGPIRAGIELPIRMSVALLKGVISPDADREADCIALNVGELVVRTRKAHLVAVHREDISRHVIARTHYCQDVRVCLCHGAERAVRDGRHRQVADHPAFVPSCLVIDHKEARDVCEHVDEGTRIVWVRRQSLLGLQNQPHGANCRQAAVREVGSGRNRFVIDSWDLRSEDVGLKFRCIEEIVLKQLTGIVGLGKGYHRREGIRSLCQLDQPILERCGEKLDIASLEKPSRDRVPKVAVVAFVAFALRENRSWESERCQQHQRS
jgi:hypothetical protein